MNIRASMKVTGVSSVNSPDKPETQQVVLGNVHPPASDSDASIQGQVTLKLSGANLNTLKVDDMCHLDVVKDES